ncbi:GIY-YIG nuclease family protein [Galliscardovia ingluviei]|nr:GIY-YIG nuclease family protein [Galliscardovia ingluviei]
MMDQSKSIKYLQQSGVYLLFGVSDEFDEPIVYIGQAGTRKNGLGILNRWEEHKRSSDKDWWTEAVALTTANNSFGPTEMSYLENRFRNMAVEAGRYRVHNGNEPTTGNLTEEKESEMEEFISYARIVIGALGYKVFEPLIAKKHNFGNIIESAPEPLLYYHSSKADATGLRTAEGFVVLSGSKISQELVKSTPDNVVGLREKNAANIGVDGVLKKDLLFASPSTAACFVGGASLSGKTAWKTKEGITLKQLEEQE